MKEIEFNIVRKFVSPICDDCGATLVLSSAYGPSSVFRYDCPCCNKKHSCAKLYPMKRDYIKDYCKKYNMPCTYNCVKSQYALAYKVCPEFIEYKEI